jgi:DNA topoisomerase-1
MRRQGQGPGHRRVAGQGQDHQQVPGRQLRGHGQHRPCPRPAQQEPQGRQEPRARAWTSSTTSSPPTRSSRARNVIISDLKRAAKDARHQGVGGDVWFATDLDREGEAIAWHLAQELGHPQQAGQARDLRRHHQGEIDKAFSNPHPIDEDRVNAQQARRILDRIVGYQVSPLLWKKVARGLSAGRVQSVAVRLVVEREREIRAFIPDEYWAIEGVFTPRRPRPRGARPRVREFLARKDEKGNPPDPQDAERLARRDKAIRAELVEVAGEKFEPRPRRRRAPSDSTTKSSNRVASRSPKLAGLRSGRDAVARTRRQGRPGPAKRSARSPGTSTRHALQGSCRRSRPSGPAAARPPFITSTLQQAGANRLGFRRPAHHAHGPAALRGCGHPRRGPGRSHHLHAYRLDAHLGRGAGHGPRLHQEDASATSTCPRSPTSSPAATRTRRRPTRRSARRTSRLPALARPGALTDDQFRLYTLIWERFVACQMTPAQWDSTTALIGRHDKDAADLPRHRRVLVFDGFYKVVGVPGRR